MQIFTLYVFLAKLGLLSAVPPIVPLSPFVSIESDLKFISLNVAMISAITVPDDAQSDCGDVIILIAEGSGFVGIRVKINS